MRNWYRSSRKRRLRLMLQVLCGIVLAVSLFMLGRYAIEALTVKDQQRHLSATFHADEEAAATSDTSLEPTPTPQATAEPAVAQEAAVALSPAPTSVTVPVIIYPNNPYAIYSYAFSGIREINSDIVAWLQVEELVDSAVVLRDNTYYLTHDIYKQENSNGALFLDDSTEFIRAQRPCTFIVYGHNMKSGTMFGSLKNYEKQTWYYEHPFITFNTLYEDGDYVVFSVGRMDVEDPLSPSYVNIYDLYSDLVEEREACLIRLHDLSSCYNRVPVSGTDQVLLLVTCQGTDRERLIVSARRLRDGETREQLQKLVP